MSGYPDDPSLWLSAAVYRVIADPYLPGVLVDRDDLRATFTDWSELIDPIVDALVEYGAVTEGSDAGALCVAPYEDAS